MSILIKGMEMPKSCGFCELRYFDGDADFCPFVGDACGYGTRHVDCPLHELPEHGDLIDICNAENAMFALGNYHLNDYKKGWNDGIEAVIENAPVVIPSNKEDAE